MLKKVIIALFVLISFLALLYVVFDRPLPQGESGPAAERLADLMLEAVNFRAWDSTTAVSWSFYRVHDFIWDKKRNLVEVRWDDMKVLLQTTDQSGRVYENNQELTGEEADEGLQTAWEYFANDSFWLAAPFKIKDPGTSRKVVKTERGSALLVQYHSGGVTPGDAYLWHLDAEGMPYAWQMWVSIIPLGGLKFSWENWTSTSGGAKIATFHKGLVDVEITNVQTASSAAELNRGIDPFLNM